MHEEVLKPQQKELLPLLSLFRKDFYLAGGTAIALQTGHRYSIDFDLFTLKDIKRKSIKTLLEKHHYSISHILFEDTIQLHCIINQVKLTFFQFPYIVDPSIDFNGIIKMPDLLSLSAMKAFALGGRGKWKDYVDLYFIFKHHYTFQQVTHHAKSLFGHSFNEKLFRQQLAYFEDISFEEEVEFVAETVQEDEVKSFLEGIALEEI